MTAAEKHKKSHFLLIFILLFVTSLLAGYIRATLAQKSFLNEPNDPSLNHKLEEIQKKIPPEIKIVKTKQVIELFKENTTIFVDARTTEAYQTEHIEDAISCPSNKETEWLPDFLQKYPFHTPLLVYCGSIECEASQHVALKLKEAGYTDITLYPEGYLVWRQVTK